MHHQEKVFSRALRIVVIGIVLVLLNSPFFIPSTVKAAAQCILNSNFQTINGSLQSAGTIGYQLTAKNIGSGTCNAASISVYYAPGETYVSGTPSATAKGYYWSLGNLAAGQSVTISLVTSLSAPVPAGNGSDQLCLSANNGTDACVNAIATATNSTPAADSQQAVPPPSPTTASQSPAQEQGIWDWDTPSTVSPQQMQTAVNDAVANGFTAIYLSIDDYLTIDALPAGAAKTAQLTNYENAVGTFLSFASQKGISVDAEAGSKDWAEPQNLWKSADIMSFVAAYNANAAHAIKFRGVQYDVEPYLLPPYNNNESLYLTQYVNFAEGLVNQDKSLGLPLALDVPSFYNDVIQWTPKVTVDGITDYTYNQLLRLLSEIPDSTMIIMAYRNSATGSNGTISIAQPEVQEADGTGVKVIVGQETGNVPPSYVTFYGQSTSQLFGQMTAVKQEFDPDASFVGMAVDYLEPFMALIGASTSTPSAPAPASSSPPPPSGTPAPALAPSGGGSGGGSSFAPPLAAAGAATSSSTNSLSLLTSLRSLIVQLIASDDDHPLTVGAKGSDVWALQVYLEIDGTGAASRALATVGPTGTFGSLTKNALAEYQKSMSIVPAVGYFGAKTHSAIVGSVVAAPFVNTPSSLANL